MLGSITIQYLREQGYVVTGISKTKESEGLVRLDAADEKAISGFLDENSFDVIINCAAILVGASERQKSEAVRLNAWLPHFLEERSMQRGMYLIQVSTDGVFSGKGGEYSEHTFCDPESFYGKSKLLGEVSSGALTVRSGFWGADINLNGTGLFHWFMQQEEPVSGYSRAYFNGVSNLEFARFADAAIQNRWTGIYHLCASEPISKFDFLSLQSEIFAPGIEVKPNTSVCIDRTLTNTRRDISYHAKGYREMMTELKSWISGRSCFAHYFDGEE